MAISMFVANEGPANALACNKDYSHVVIAGRNVFKVFAIEDHEFVEKHNLRVGKNLNLNFSCNDVAWNNIEESILATAATNGAVVVWNLNRPSRLKQDCVFVDHKRTVNKVSFHPADSVLLISGSQDGTMKYFDLRLREATRTFYSNTESVRDVQFSPHFPHVFAAVSENGNVQLWDPRKPDKCLNQFTAHSGPVFACDWHPDASWLATASRDKTIKVWNMQTKQSLEYTIPTIASVGRIKWRPQRKFHLASCALVVDCCINVWDVRRPYIPFASFDKHKDVGTSIAWRGEPHRLLSTSRDCTLYHHIFKDAYRPADKANPQGLAIHCRGEIIGATRINAGEYKPLQKISAVLKKQQVQTQEEHFHKFFQSSSSLCRFVREIPKETQSFLECAKKYRLSGYSLGEMCDHNSLVAADVGKHHVSLVWNIIKTLYTSKDCGQQSSGSTKDEVGLIGRSMTVNASDSVMDGDQRSIIGGENTGGISGGSEDNETDDTPEQLINGGINIGCFQKGLRASQGDFCFGEGEMDPSVEFDILKNGYSPLILGSGMVGGSVHHSDIDEWTLSPEAFALRHEIRDHSPPPEHYPLHGSPELNDNDPEALLLEEHPSLQLIVTSVPQLIPWDPGKSMVAMLQHHAQLGDVQTVASVLIVLGERRKSLPALDEVVQEQWLLGYLELLSVFKLWNVATQVIQLSWIPTISQLNQQSTTVFVCCGKCDKTFQRTGWLCDRCHSSETSICSVCHQVVKGLYSWCQGCSHGGHLLHIQEWWKKEKQCPTGCGHICEYS